MSTISPYALGATLYMPATRHDLADVVLNGKIPGLRSLVICLEDAVSDSDVEGVLKTLKSSWLTLTALADAHHQIPFCSFVLGISRWPRA